MDSGLWTVHRHGVRRDELDEEVVGLLFDAAIRLASGRGGDGESGRLDSGVVIRCQWPWRRWPPWHI